MGECGHYVGVATADAKHRKDQTMKAFTITCDAAGNQGTYEGKTELEAWAAYCADAGYDTAEPDANAGDGIDPAVINDGFTIARAEADPSDYLDFNEEA